MSKSARAERARTPEEQPAETPRAEAEGRVKGSCMAVTATFGMCLAAAAVRAVVEGGR